MEWIVYFPPPSNQNKEAPSLANISQVPTSQTLVPKNSSSRSIIHENSEVLNEDGRMLDALNKQSCVWCSYNSISR
jgi:hypothetical protein